MVNLGRVLWDFTLNVLRAMDLLYDFMTTPIPIVTYTLMGGINYIMVTPMEITGTAIIAIVTITIISVFNPNV